MIGEMSTNEQQRKFMMERFQEDVLEEDAGRNGSVTLINSTTFMLRTKA